jgi:hypothetical protein
MIRAALAAFAAAVALAPAAAEAGWFYLTPQGLKHLDEITRAIAPVAIERNPQTGQHWFRGFLVAVSPPKNPAAGLTHLDAWDEAGIVPVDASWRKYAKPVTLSAAWVRGGAAFHTIRDLRDYGGNFDEVYGTPVGSHRYLAHLYTAIDADGSMGLRPASRAAPAVRPARLVDGILVGMIRVQRAPLAQRATLARQLFGSLPVAEGTWLSNRVLVFNSLAQLQRLPYWIAADRQYRFPEHRRGYPMAAEGIALALLTLETVPSERAATSGIALSGTLIEDIKAAVPGSFNGAYDDPRLQALIDDVQAAVVTGGADRKTPDPQTLAAALSRYEGEAKRLMATPAPSSILDPSPRVDPSYRARVAFDLLKISDAVFFHDEHQLQELVATLTMYGHTPFWPDPRRQDRLNLRASAVELLDRLANPPRSTDPRIEGQRRRASESCRQALFYVAWAGRRGQRELALDRLRQAGWGTEEQLTQFVDRIWDAAWQGAEHEVWTRTPPPPLPPAEQALARADKASHDEQLRYALGALSRLYDLAGSTNAAHAAAGARVRHHLASASRRTGDDPGAAAGALVGERFAALRRGAPAPSP